MVKKIIFYKNKWIKKGLIVLWIVFLSFLVIFPLYIWSVSANLFNLYGGMPSLKSLENPKSDLSSELYSADNVLLGKYYRENRSQVTYEELSPNLINALLCTEDYRFDQHSGIDPRGMARVFFYSILLGKDAGGGSTITQQLAKKLYRTRSEKLDGHLSNVPGIRMLIIKTKEWILAVHLERSYTKKEILSMYLNTVDFGSNAFGIKVASQTFFNTPPDSLNIQQAAMLAGLLNAPTRYSPVRNPENAMGKRTEVLFNLHKYGFLSRMEFDSIRNLPMDLQYNVQDHNEGPAGYFRNVVGRFLLGWCRENGHDLYEDGLKIYTTIDYRLQEYAEKALNQHMKSLQKTFENHWDGRNPWIDENGREIKNFLQIRSRNTDHYRMYTSKYGKDSDSVRIMMNTAKPMKIFTWDGEKDTLMSPMDSLNHYKRHLNAGFLAMDPHNGHIKAWVGGINYKYLKFDHVRQGRRQPGSTFKPIVYAAALDNGYSPCYEVIDAPVTFQVHGEESTWTPKNSNGVFTGEKMTIRRAMASSVNSITAYMMKKIGPETVVDYARRLGITSPLTPVPAICLGTEDVSLFELVGAYSTFVNEGVYTEPFFITRIEDKNGNVLQDFVPKTIEALNETSAYLMLHMLKGATEERGGTALGVPRDLREGMEIGAKTGTTQNASDGWFMGVTKDLVAGAWVGGDDRVIRFRNWGMGQGARTAMPIWTRFMTDVYTDPNSGYVKGPFKKPNRPLNVEIDCNKYDSEDYESDSLDRDRMEINEKDIM